MKDSGKGKVVRVDKNSSNNNKNWKKSLAMSLLCSGGFSVITIRIESRKRIRVEPMDELAVITIRIERICLSLWISIFSLVSNNNKNWKIRLSPACALSRAKSLVITIRIES